MPAVDLAQDSVGKEHRPRNQKTDEREPPRHRFPPYGSQDAVEIGKIPIPGDAEAERSGPTEGRQVVAVCGLDGANGVTARRNDLARGSQEGPKP